MAAIIAILASAVMPLLKVTVQRNREIELHRALRDMRTAIDKYKDAADQNLIADPPTTAEGYPPSLDVLVEGVPAANDAVGTVQGSGIGALRHFRGQGATRWQRARGR